MQNSLLVSTMHSIFLILVFFLSSFSTSSQASEGRHLPINTRQDDAKRGEREQQELESNHMGDTALFKATKRGELALARELINRGL